MNGRAVYMTHEELEKKVMETLEEEISSERDFIQAGTLLFMKPKSEAVGYLELNLSAMLESLKNWLQEKGIDESKIDKLERKLIDWVILKRHSLVFYDEGERAKVEDELMTHKE